MIRSIGSLLLNEIVFLPKHFMDRIKQQQMYEFKLTREHKLTILMLMKKPSTKPQRQQRSTTRAIFP